MKKGVYLVLNDAEIIELCRILLDDDAPAALDLIGQCWECRDTVQPVTAGLI